MDNNVLAENKQLNIEVQRITNASALEKINAQRNKIGENIEQLPWAINTPFNEIAESVIPDKKGPWATPLYYIRTVHRTNIGLREICIKAEQYIKSMDDDIDMLSIFSTMENGRLVLKTLVRDYDRPFNFTGFFDYVGDNIVEDKESEEYVATGRLLIPEEIKNFKYTDSEMRQHEIDYKHQQEKYEKATKEVPFLNQITDYVPKKLPNPADIIDYTYDLKTSDQHLKTKAPYEDFTNVFREIMTYVNGVEYYHYIQVIKEKDPKKEKDFMEYLEQYIQDNYVRTEKMYSEDVPAMVKKLYRSLFQLYIIQDLIDDPDVTDIKITAFDSIRTRIHGKAYITNISFIDNADYLRFINALCLKNNILQSVPEQTFTDQSDENYILRLTLSAAYVNSTNVPYLHIRKVDRNKPLGDDLIRLGMMPPKVRDYLLDQAKTSRGVIFSGPPGSGKTIALNWFLEEGYEQSAEILVIQENDELFAYRKGVMFKHPVKYSGLELQPITLEELGQLALVAGANVFIIGEVKGAEICSALTLSNSGCRTALTIHSFSATEVIEKMADLAMRGEYKDFDQAKKNIKSFQTIVYLEDFKVREIAEIDGYDRDTKEMKYKYIYKYEEENDVAEEAVA